MGNRLYWTATVAHSAKYIVRALYSPSSHSLVIPERDGISRISNALGFYDRSLFIEKLKIAREAGMITLVETRDEKFVKHSPIIDLGGRSRDLRSLRDRYYEKFKGMFEAGEISFPKGGQESIAPMLRNVREKFNPVNSRTVYDFSKAQNNELMALLVLIAAHVDPPKNLGYFLEVERGMSRPIRESMTKTQRMMASLDKYELDLQRDFDERTAEAQKRFPKG